MRGKRKPKPKQDALYDTRPIEIALIEHELTGEKWEEKSGLNTNTITAIRHARSTQLAKLVQGLRTIGLTIQIVRISEHNGDRARAATQR